MVDQDWFLHFADVDAREYIPFHPAVSDSQGAVRTAFRAGTKLADHSQSTIEFGPGDWGRYEM